MRKDINSCRVGRVEGLAPWMLPVVNKHKQTGDHSIRREGVTLLFYGIAL